MISLDLDRQSISGNRPPSSTGRYLLSVIYYLLSVTCPCLPADASPAEARLSLAASLHESGDYARSALEYRRLAADLEPDDPSISGLYLAAADAYRCEKDWDRLGKMLDKAEDAGAGGSAPLLFLRAQRAEGMQDWFSAGDYAVELAGIARDDERLAAWSRGAAASDYLRSRWVDDARGAVAGDHDRAAAIDRYVNGRDKSPTVGGLLGIVPGLGYAYSGEWGNMFRSIFLNGIFGWAMFECADREQWGLFAVTTFFELTWYSGSIYGGIDAAHRYNRDRIDDAARELRGGEGPSLRPENRLNVFSMRLEF